MTQVKAPDREGDVDVLEVVHARAADGEPLQRHAPLAGELDAAAPGEILAGQRGLVGHDLLRRALGHDAAAVLAGAGPHVDDVVRQAHGLLVVLHDDDGVAEVAQAQQRLDEAAVVALVQADAGLVEDVEHADERRADLRGEADALRLAAGERGRGALQGEVADADVVEEAEALADLLDHAAADEALGVAERQAFQERERLAHAHQGELVDVALADGDGEARGLEPCPVALRARPVRHVLLDLLADLLRLGLHEAPLEVLDDAGEARVVVAHAPLVVAVAERDALLAGAVEEQVPVLLGHVVPRHAGVDAERLGDALEHLLEPAERELAVGKEGPLVDADGAVRYDQVGVDLLREPEAVAGGAGAVRRVEAEDARLDLGQRDATVDAGELLAEGERALVVPGEFDVDEAVGEGGGGLDGVGEPPPQALLHDEPVDDHGDVVLELLVELDVLFEFAYLAVDLDPDEAVGAELLEELAVLALAPAHDRGDHAEASALFEFAHLVDDLLHALPEDGPPALGAVRVPDAGVEQAQVVVDLGDRAHGGARVAGGRLLVDGDGRRKALDAVDVRLVHLAEELAGVGGEALHVAALALGVDGVEGERGLARAREAGDDDEAVARQPQGDVLEVVLAGAVDDEVAGHWLSVSQMCPRSVSRSRRGVPDRVAKRTYVRNRSTTTTLDGLRGEGEATLHHTPADIGYLLVVPDTGAFADLGQRRLHAEGGPVGPVRRHRLDHVGDGEDAGLREDGVTAQALRIARAVHALVVLKDHLRHRLVEVDRRQDVVAGLGVLLDEIELDHTQAPGLGQDLGRHRDLADVVDEARQPQPVEVIRRHAHLGRDGHRELGHASLVPGGVGVARFHDVPHRQHGAPDDAA